MIYLDTSALIKLYLIEEGSESVQRLLTEQDDPLPVWELQEAELLNALRLKVFWKDIQTAEAEHQISLFQQRKRKGLYFFPQIDRIELQETFKEISFHTMELGCRTMDVMHVACAVQIKPDHFVSFDSCQCALAERIGLKVPSIANDFP